LPAHKLPDGAIDHKLDWYQPAEVVSLGAESSPLDAAPTFSVNAAGLPLLTSRSDGTGFKVFLDFDGFGANLPFSTDGDTANYSPAEQNSIYYTWRDMVSYFSALNVNVTTVQPPTGGSNPSFAWHLTSNSISGGYAYVGWLDNSAPHGFNQGSNAVSRRSGIAHEIGHLLGLYHQGEYDLYGNLTSEYSDGWDSRSRTVIGIDYNTNIRQWFYGRSSSNAGSLQNDLQLMANTVSARVGGDGFRPDDFGGTIATAASVPANGMVEAFIERYSDADVFQINSSGGRWNFDATPIFESSVEPKLELLDASGIVIASKDDADQRSNVNNNDVEFSLDLTAGIYYVKVSSSGDISELGEYLMTASPLMSGFRTQDVSTVFRTGSVSYDPVSGVITQIGGGADIANASDQFRFTYNILDGNGSITVRVDSVDNVDPLAKAGVMIRQSLSNNSASMLLNVQPSGALNNVRRASAGATATNVGMAAGLLGPWLRLERAGDTFSMSRSSDGISWDSVASTAITMSGPVYIGLATNARNDRYAAYSTFSNLSLTGNLGAATPTYNALPSPVNVTASPAAGASTSINLAWDDVAGETSYAVERSADGVNFTQIATPATNATTYTDTNVWGSMRWHYRVSSRSGSTNSVPSAIISTVNKPNAPTAPPASYAMTSMSNSTSTLHLNWRDVQGDQGYRIERSPDGVNYTQIATTAANFNAYNASGLSAGLQYTFRITPITSVGDGLAPSFLINASTRLTTVSGLNFTSKQSNSMNFQWSNISNETGYRIERSVDGTSWSALTTVGANVTSHSDTTVSGTNEYYYRVWGTSSLTQSLAASSVIFGATPSGTALPVNWSSQDIGSVGGTGAANVLENTWTLLGSGNDIGGTSDQFRFTSRSLQGDGEIIARVAGIENTSASAKAGIMIRESLAGGSRYAFAYVTPSSGSDFDVRSSIGANPVRADGPAGTSPYWVKLNRTGNIFTASSSPDGVTWTALTQQTLSMTTNVYIGFALTSNNTTQLARATFDNVSVTGLIIGGGVPTVLNQANANPSPVIGTTAALSVLGQDDGGAANLTYSWSVTTLPAGAATPTFSINNTNAAANTTATFYATGGYTFRATITDALGQSTTSDVIVNVNPTATAVTLSPSDGGFNPGEQQLFSASVLDQFNQTMSGQLQMVWSADRGEITSAGLWTAPVESGPATIIATVSGLSGNAAVNVNFQSTPVAFNADTSPQAVDFAVNGAVNTATLEAGDLELLDLDTMTPISAANTFAAYISAQNILRFRFTGFGDNTLPDGNYRATLGASVADIHGNTLINEGTTDFFVLSGDANRDRFVDTLDFNLLANHFAQTSMAFSQGDFNYDNEVNSLDFNIFVARYGKRLVAPAAMNAPLPLFRDGADIGGGGQLDLIQ